VARKGKTDSTGYRRKKKTPELPPVLRIIGGRMRGRKLIYGGDRRTRPMKDRVREAVFNLLGPGIKGKIAIDLFAGTGALGLEAISRGAIGALLIEQHYPTAEVIRQNITGVGIDQPCEVISADTFIWARRDPSLPESPWVVFCSPPYDFYVEREADMLGLVAYLLDHAPVGSLFAVEADERFDFSKLPQPERWDVRCYPPATVGVLSIQEDATDDPKEENIEGSGDGCA